MKKIGFLASVFLFGCASSITDFENGLDNFPKAETEIPTDVYPLFGILQAQWQSCWPTYLSNPQGLRSYYYTSPKAWGLKYDVETLELFIASANIDLIQKYDDKSLKAVCMELKDLAWDKALSETMKGVSIGMSISNIASLSNTMETMTELGFNSVYISSTAINTSYNAANMLIESDVPKGLPALPQSTFK